MSVEAKEFSLEAFTREVGEVEIHLVRIAQPSALARKQPAAFGKYNTAMLPAGRHIFS